MPLDGNGHGSDTLVKKQNVHRVCKLATFWRPLGTGPAGILRAGTRQRRDERTMNEKLLARGLEKGHLTNFPTLVLERLANLIGQLED